MASDPNLSPGRLVWLTGALCAGDAIFCGLDFGVAAYGIAARLVIIAAPSLWCSSVALLRLTRGRPERRIHIGRHTRVLAARPSSLKMFAIALTLWRRR